MQNNFRNLKGLVINSYKPTQNMLATSLKMAGFGQVHAVSDATAGFSHFMKENPDVVIADIVDGVTDGIGFAKKAREAAGAANRKIPVICIAGPQAQRFVEEARKIGLIEFLETPYTIDDITNRLAYVLTDDFTNKNSAALPAPEQEDLVQRRSVRPDEEESRELALLLLEHYLRHHEIVLRKLHFAKDATKICVEKLRATGDKLQSADLRSETLKQDFERMWVEILEQFRQGGLSQDELNQVESIIERIPNDIKVHYDALTQQDKGFLELVESLNVSAYKAARAIASRVQSEPNMLSGRTEEDYKPAEKSEDMAEIEKTMDWRFIKK